MTPTADRIENCHRRVARCYIQGMTRSSQPTRLPTDVYDWALVAAPVNSRTVPQQIAHWARLGRELEMSPQVSHRSISEVLGGSRAYDALSEPEQAIVRQEWAERARAARGALDYAARFAADGESYSELDEHGAVVVHPARD